MNEEIIVEVKESQEKEVVQVTNSNVHLIESKTKIRLPNDDYDRSSINKILLTLCVLIGILFVAIIAYAFLTSKFTSKTINKYDLKQEFDDNLPDIPITISEKSFGKSTRSNGEEVKYYLLKNQVGCELALISFGASVQSLKIKDTNGNLVEVILGLQTIEEYENPVYNRHFGGIVGRTSNRISNAEFTLDGIKYTLDKNNGVNSLHGGLSGFDMRNWQSSVLKDGVKFELFSKDLEGGYPGDVNVEVIYRLSTNSNEISIDYRANTTKSTPLDLTNHAYFNLNGNRAETETDGALQPIYNHEFRLFADNYLPANTQDSIVTGEILQTRGTKYCFHNFVKLSDRMESNGAWPQHGYDNFFLINQNSGRKHVASVRNAQNGIQFDVFSDQNGVQFYTGNYLNVVKTNGVRYDRHCGFCLETHNHPDAVNRPHFPSAIVRPEGEYRQSTKWIFTNF